MDISEVFGTELQVSARGSCTGMVQVLMLGQSKAEAMKKVFGEEGSDLGLGIGAAGSSFLTLCKVR